MQLTHDQTHTTTKLRISVCLVVGVMAHRIADMLIASPVILGLIRGVVFLFPPPPSSPALFERWCHRRAQNSALSEVVSWCIVFCAFSHFQTWPRGAQNSHCPWACCPGGSPPWACCLDFQTIAGAQMIIDFKTKHNCRCPYHHKHLNGK